MTLDPWVVEAYEKYAGDLVAYATVLVGPSDAEDVVADAMLRVLSRRRREVDNARNYLLRCVLHQAASSRRRSGIGAMKERAALNDRAAAAPLDRDDSLLDRLSVRERAVVYLTYWDDLAPTGVAAVLGISEGAVRKYLARARAKLREVCRDE